MYFVLGFIVLISIIVFVHEMGHYLVAKWCGVGAEVFSIGFGRRLFSYVDSSQTRWQVCMIPLGGYVLFRGDMDPSSSKHLEEDDDSPSDAFHVQPLYKRMLIVAAGPLANFLFAMVVISAMLWMFGKTQLSARVDQIQQNSPAQEAGFEVGDWFVSVDGTTIESFRDVQRRIGLSAGDEVEVVVDREGELVNLTVIPERVEIDDSLGGKAVIGRIGVTLEPTKSDRNHIEYSLPSAMAQSVTDTWKIASDTGRFLKRIFYDSDAAKQVGGPLRIAHVSGKSAERGIITYIQLLVVLSVNVGLLNLLPIPILDGGHLLLGGYEAVARRRPSKLMVDIAFRGGGVMLACIFVFALINDLINLGLIDSIATLFA